MKTYRFTNNGREFVIEAVNLTVALTIYREQLRDAS
jgi:hypothetical protein